MKRYALTMIVGVLACITVCITCAQGGTTHKVLLILREGAFDLELMLTKEAGVMTSMLEDAGFEVTVASVSGQPFVGRTTTVKPDLKLADVKVSDYAGFIILCMSINIFLPVPGEAVEIVKQAMADGKPVAAQYAGIYILAEAGALRGHNYAVFDNPGGDVRFADAIYIGRGVVQDGNIVTSGVCPLMAREHGLPDGTSELTQALIDQLPVSTAIEPRSKMAATFGGIKCGK